MSRIGVVVLAALVALVTAGFRPAGLSDGEQAGLVIAAHRAEALADPPGPDLGAPAVMLLDEPTGQVLFERGAHERRAMASTTKLMTALLVVETGRYFERVTTEPADLIGGSSMGLVSGEHLSPRALLDGLLMASGNDAAQALARHFGGRLPGPGGPVARFVAAMNGRAAELGLADTAFRNPSGLDMEGHYSTAADLATLARAAIRQPVIAQIVATNVATVEASKRTYMVRNTNQLFGVIPGVLGVKTGTTDAAGECLIALVEQDGRRLLAVVLGSEDRYPDTISLLHWGFATHRWLEVPPGLAEAAERPGWSVAIGPNPPFAVPASQVHLVQYRLHPAGAGAPPGGTIVVLLVDRPLTTRHIVAVPLGATRRPLPGW